MDLATAQTLLRDQHVALVILFDTHHNLAIGVCVEPDATHAKGVKGVSMYAVTLEQRQPFALKPEILRDVFQARLTPASSGADNEWFLFLQPLTDPFLLKRSRSGQFSVSYAFSCGPNRSKCAKVRRVLVSGHFTFPVPRVSFALEGRFRRQLEAPYETLKHEVQCPVDFTRRLCACVLGG